MAGVAANRKHEIKVLLIRREDVLEVLGKLVEMGTLGYTALQEPGLQENAWGLGVDLNVC